MLRRRSAITAGAVLACLLAAGCSNAAPPPPAHPHVPAAPASRADASSAAARRQPHILVFTATGDAGVDSVTYIVDGHSVTASAVSLPWRVSLPVPADGAKHNYSVTMNTSHGSVQILAILDGAVQTSSNGFGSGTNTTQLSGDFAN